MTTTHTPISDVPVPVPRPVDRAPGRSVARAQSALAVESRTISTLTQALIEAEGRALVAADELECASAEREQHAAELAKLRADCERLRAALPAIEQAGRDAIERNRRLDRQLAEQQRLHGRLAAALEAERARLADCAQRASDDRAAADARLVTSEQATEAIEHAEGLAAIALEGARHTVLAVQLECEQQAEQAELALAEAQQRAERAELVAASLRAVAEAPSSEELRLQRELEAARRENDELLVRLQRYDRELRSREREVERERRLADEAARWASRAEHALAAAAPVHAPEAQSAGAAPISPLAPSRRRAPRVRVRRGA